MSEKAAPECLILDDSELETAGASASGFRNWRMDASQLTASRIFGGGPAVTPVAGTQPTATGFRSFPSAFQTYKPGTGRASGGDKRFPFFEQQAKKRMDRKEAEQRSAGSAIPPTIQIPPSPPEDDSAPRYSQCTPPCYSPKTPPYWDASGNLIVAGQIVTENPPSKQDEGE
jgi:hypothetical protein